MVKRKDPYYNKREKGAVKDRIQGPKTVQAWHNFIDMANCICPGMNAIDILGSLHHLICNSSPFTMTKAKAKERRAIIRM